eukprot:Blabericola_migrator_1__13456@NODE_96_length_14432_cov_203_974173_g86_i0_p3_GENE_NODE_96_length_14432_cov_203_974173_g86_i0NODE_96_length_14432_cov_203_974173_g86_i0_p3_ORF_typecomplete_len479_score86_22zfCCCH/PF00642_24/0_014zfCCCH/PF00642_24/1_5zfCCCH/PF00642_24/3e07zfCCCH_3/PF15663_5/4_3e06zfCCCH_3/PF15663_5/0_00097zfCCCH_4/PF18044_1/0_00091zfCCCH_4/PF18044_1/2_6e03zfCCCH_4/PF18044_1/0_00013zf_CCCH_4/PF18345_1/0_011zf_CCCH_4/PF18345_1/18zf_CCCH_4/PF18345_1/0_00089Torus/PF16131_5/1_1e04Torus/P
MDSEALSPSSTYQQLCSQLLPPMNVTRPSVSHQGMGISHYFHRLPPSSTFGPSNVTLPKSANFFVDKQSSGDTDNPLWPSSTQSTRPSSAQKSTPPSRQSEEEQSPDKRNSNGPSTLTLSSPTALLSSAPEWQSQFYRTKLCPFYVKDIPEPNATQWGSNVGWAGGECVNGDHCRFAHSTSELRPLPDLRKTKLCSSYTKKVPCKNTKCPFAHSPKELRTSSSIFYKVTLCNFYKNGKCWNGSNCRFAHGNEELRNATNALANASNNATSQESDQPPSQPTQQQPPPQQQPPAFPPRQKGFRHKEGLLPRPGRSSLPPPPPSFVSEPPVESRRPSLSSLSTADASMASWKAAQRCLTKTQAVPEQPSIEAETAADEAPWFEGDDVPEDPPGFSPLKSHASSLDFPPSCSVSVSSEAPSPTLEPELLDLLISILNNFTAEAPPPPPPVFDPQFSCLPEANDDGACLQVLLKLVQGKLDS